MGKRVEVEGREGVVVYFSTIWIADGFGRDVDREWGLARGRMGLYRDIEVEREREMWRGGGS